MDLLIEFSYRPEGGSSFQVRWGNWSESNSSSFYSLGGERSVLFCVFFFFSSPSFSSTKKFQLKIETHTWWFPRICCLHFATSGNEVSNGRNLMQFASCSGFVGDTRNDEAGAVFTKMARKLSLLLLANIRNIFPIQKSGHCGWVTKLLFSRAFFKNFTLFYKYRSLCLRFVSRLLKIRGSIPNKTLSSTTYYI